MSGQRFTDRAEVQAWLDSVGTGMFFRACTAEDMPDSDLRLAFGAVEEARANFCRLLTMTPAPETRAVNTSPGPAGPKKRGRKP